MSYKIVYNVDGSVIGKGFPDEESAYRELVRRGVTPEQTANFSVLPEEARSTTYEERKDYFKNTSPTLAEMFPNVAENYMKGKRGFVENIPGAIGDISSYIPRAASSVVNGLSGEKERYNLGRRSVDEGTGIIGSIARSPTLIPGMGAGANVASKVGSKVFNIGERILGAGVAGATIGGSDAAMNNRNPRTEDYALGAAFGAGGELGIAGISALARKVKQLLSRSDGDLQRAVASALWLGNTDRVMTKAEFDQFMSDPRNADVFDKTMKAVTSVRGMLSNDRGKALEPAIEEAMKKGSRSIENEPILNSAFDNSVPDGLSPTKERMARQNAALDRKGLEPYHDKTVFEPGKHDLKDDAFPTEYPEARVFSKKLGNTKTDRYQSSLEYNVEKHADKWDTIGSAMNGIRTSKRPMNADEAAVLKKIENELARDQKILSKYNPKKLIDKARFLRDVNPFEKNEIYNKDIQELFEKYGSRGLSSDFVNQVNELTATARTQGEFAMNNLRSGLELKNSSAVERAFAYASGDNAEYAVVKNYKNAVDDFADALSDYADNSIANGRRKNSKGEDYQVEPGRMKRYAFSYLKKVQDVLRKKGALSAEDVTGLYGDATQVNDKTVQDAIIKLLRRLGIDKDVIARFENEAREYTMLNKARAKFRKKANGEDNPLKGTALGYFYPQEGVNLGNIVKSKANRAADKVKEKTYDLGAATRGLIYSGGYRDKKK